MKLIILIGLFLICGCVYSNDSIPYNRIDINNICPDGYTQYFYSVSWDSEPEVVFNFTKDGMNSNLDTIDYNRTISYNLKCYKTIKNSKENE